MNAVDLKHVPVFPARPTDAYLLEWRDWIAATGAPEKFKNVSTSKPTQIDNIVLLSEEISVPVGRREGGGMVPCPFCSPTEPKFKNGRMAYFPDEKVVRFVGHRCAESHFGENYRAAEHAFRRQQGCQRYQALWQTAAPHLDGLAAYLAELASCADRFQLVRERLDQQAVGFSEFLHTELAQTGGDLSIMEDLGMKDRHGEAVIQKRSLGVAAGLRFLAHDFDVAGILRRARMGEQALRVPLPEWKAETPEHPATDAILKAGRGVERVLKAVPAARDGMLDAQAFLKGKNLALIQRWGSHPASPFSRLEIKRDERQLFVRSNTYRGQHYANVLVPPETADPLPSVPAAFTAILETIIR